MINKTNPLLAPTQELESFSRVFNAVRNQKTVFASGVIDSQKAHLVYSVMAETGRPAVFITSTQQKAREAYEDLKYFLKGEAYDYPAKDILYYSADARSAEIMKRRFAFVDKALNGADFCGVMPIDALLNKLTEKEIFKKYILSFKDGDTVDISELAQKLVYMGYERTHQVEAAGQFAIRGGIFDVYSVIEENPIRFELWDNEIDSIRIIDAASQRSIEKRKQTTIFPMRELVYDDAEMESAVSKIEKDFEKAQNAFEQNKQTEAQSILTEIVKSAVEKLREQKTFSNVENYFNYFYDGNTCLFDYLPENTVLFFDEPQRIRQKMDTLDLEYAENAKTRLEGGFILSGQAKRPVDYDVILSKSRNFSCVLMATMTFSLKDFAISDIIGFSVKDYAGANRRIDTLKEDLVYYAKQNYRIIILAGARTRAERLAAELLESGFNAAFYENLEGRELLPGQIALAKGSLHKSFEYPYVKFIVITGKDIFGEEKPFVKRKKKRRDAKKLNSFTDLKIGDYVVHDNHGIGVYRGIEKIISDNVSKDYLKISYADGGHLYVNTNQLDLIQKYIGGEDIKPKINKLGGAEWQKARERAKTAVKALAIDLVELYAKRQASKGFLYSKDTVWQREFEELFPYEETDDQLLAIEDVKADMESGRVMDRLICGDVGYGKTEIAIRAAFKTVMDAKQVAYLVPTTILAQQHYNTFLQRMKDFPVNIELLCRFRTSKQQKDTVEKLKKGAIDIVIGTHRLLSADVSFKDLGLIVVDEEQRFGVSHKEKLKLMKENVDVLTLTATPIPRTLHMSLTGIRDMSVLEDPPQERQPIQTYILEYNPDLVREAILREIDREGQVYYLYNRVKNIQEVTYKIQQLVPDALVAYAHGQMSERELENIMAEFIEGKIDVLVCTTIIETGLDIANVNTIIVQEADQMGLSQLYQLRGRVGRSNRISYAYLMYKRDKILSEVQEARLRTIREFTEFGAGFKIAMRDLEIRGAGNVLGAEQHGYMDAVGYDTYCRLLEEAVSELKGEETKEKFDTLVDINISAYIPDFYIEDETQKLEVYKKIALVETNEDYQDVWEEIEDRFGELPKVVINLLDIALLKGAAHNAGVISLSEKNKGIIITFKQDSKASPEKIADIVNKNRGRVFFTIAPNPYITYKLYDNNYQEHIKKITVFLQNII